MKHLIVYSLVIVVALTACNAGSGRRADVQATAPVTTTPPSGTTPAGAGGQLPINKASWMPSQTASLPADPGAGGRKNPPHGQPGHQCGVAVGAPLGGAPAAQPVTAALPAGSSPITPVSLPATTTPAPPQGTAAATPAKNPPHGQPGHRCDLAVGAPLTGAPAAKPAAQPATATTTTTTPAKPATTAAPGMNPAHGQPGHRCDIAVGAPLNSPAPAKPAATTTPAAAPATTPPATTAQPQTVSPLLPTSTATPVLPAAAGGSKLNPPHGQPGHDCSVKVGEPLKQ